MAFAPAAGGPQRELKVAAVTDGPQVNSVVEKCRGSMGLAA
jgi:hypothetical protein